jgi:plastocyanin
MRAPRALLAFLVCLPLALASPAYAATRMVSVADFAFTPQRTTAAQGDTVEWRFAGPSTHTATDLTGMGLFDSGHKAPGTVFDFVFAAAGSYPYECTIHPSMQGQVVVPLRVSPRMGGVTTMFTVTWATVVPTGSVADVRIRRLGSTAFVAWKTGQTLASATFVPDAGPGTYSFKARLRNPAAAKASAFSPAVAIQVS